MSTTRNIMASALFAKPFIGYQPINISNGEPALTAANITKQTMTGPPMKWIFNRGSFTVELDPTQDTWAQDYTVEISNYGFLEQVWLTDPDGDVKEIKVKNSLAGESAIKRPSSAAANMLDEQGNVILRLNTRPDVAYRIDGYFQRAPIWMSSLAATWSPFPDHLAYIYDWGFLGFVSLLTKDARAPIFLGKFVSHLLGAQDGLTALERNIFLGNFLDLITQAGREQMMAQQGVQARGAL